LREKFFADNLSLSLSTDVRRASGTVAPKRDSVMCRCSYSYMIKLIYYTRIFRNFIEMLGRNPEFYADIVRPKLS
jgi:hypothetical protein